MLLQLAFTLILLTATTKTQTYEKEGTEEGTYEGTLRDALSSLDEVMANSHGGLMGSVDGSIDEMMGSDIGSFDEMPEDALIFPVEEEVGLKSAPKSVAEIEKELKAILKSATVSDDK